MSNRSRHNPAHMMMNVLKREGKAHSSQIEWKEPDSTLHLVRICDAVDMLKSLPPSSIQLIIIDPPYNLEIETWDKFDDYIGWAKQWLNEIPRVLADKGNAVIFGGVQFQSDYGGDLLDIMHYIRHSSLLILINDIVWHYSTGMSAHRFFASRHEQIVWYAKTNKYFFDLDAVREKFDQKTLNEYRKDKRLNPKSLEKGKNPTNVWHIERLSGNSKERVGHPTQKPTEVIRRIVRSMSYPGSVVLDFFAGSGVTTRVCIEEKRHSIISDIDPTLNQYLEKHLHQIKDKKHQFQILKEECISKYLEKLP